MGFTSYRNRKAYELSNDKLTATVTVEGGHIASIVHKRTGVNPLWVPIWPSVEPSAYEAAKHPEYGTGNEAKLLAGILGHNLCLDLFGGPSEDELAAGLSSHGEANIVSYAITEESGGAVAMRCILPQAGLQFERVLRLPPGSDVLLIRETVTNLSACDRPIAWTQHVTLGPPFLERGVTQFRAPGGKSRVIESDFTEGRGVQKTGADFDWPMCPRKDGGAMDLRVYTAEPVSAGFTATMMDPQRERAFFMAYQPKAKLLFGYVWKRTDFPWLGRWEENHLRTHKPWNGQSLTLGMEFGASPFPETRRAMIERGSLFGVPAYRWLPARRSATVEYCAFAVTREAIAETVEWDGWTGLRLG